MKKVIEAIRKHKRFLITAHVNLEGDSLGSQLAVKELLDGLGKEAFIVDADEVPAHYKFLPKAKAISNDIDVEADFDAAIVLDCPTLKRIGRVRGAITKDKFIINIDHHISNEKFGDINWVDPNASSAGEMVYRLFRKMRRPMTKEIALSLYIAILTDTGSFNYNNTSSVTHEIAGELLGYGLEPAVVSESVYEKRSLADIKLLGLVLDSLKVNRKGNVAFAEITGEMLKQTGADVSKAEGFVNYARSIEGVDVAVLFREEPRGPGGVHVSFRSRGEVDVNKIASYFGGGGHVRASGCVIKGRLKEVEKKVVKKVEVVLSGRNTRSR